MHTHQDVRAALGASQVTLRSYDWLLNTIRLPRGTYIFTDRDRLAPWELRVFADLCRHINQAGPGYRAINDPARMANRFTMLRSLYKAGLNDFNAYLPTELLEPQRWPVFIRREFNHGYPLSELLEDQAALDQAIEKLIAEGEPLDGLLITEYCAEPLEPDLYRKLSAYRIGDEVLFYNCVHDRNWLVKYGTKNCATDAMYQDEQNMILNNAFEAEIRQAFDLAGIDYGRVDFGLVDGRVQVYEINTNPDTNAPSSSHPNPTRSKNMQLGWDKYLQALQQVDNTDPQGPMAAPFGYAQEIAHHHLKRTAKRLKKLFRVKVLRR